MDLERDEQRRGLDSAEAAPSLFSDRGPRVFLVSNPLMAFSGGQECPLVEGDVQHLLSAMTGRKQALADLSGDGVNVLRGR